ncbi:MAG: glycosyltransferase [Candidatus Competibacteraceae bacterium]
MNNQKKICMIAYAHYSYDARIKAYTRTIEQIGGTVDIFALREQGKKKFEQIGNSRIFYLANKYQGSNGFFYLISYIAFFIKAFIKVSYMFVKEKYTAIHVHNMPNFIIFAAILPRILGARVILDIHDLMTVNYMVKFNVDADNFLIKCLIFEQKISARFASYLLCADHNQKNYLESVCNIPQKKIKVIMNLPNEEIFHPVERVNLNHDKFRLIYHGTIAKRLGIDIMLEAISKIGDQIPIHLSIYGSGDFLAEAVSIANKLNLDGKVYFSKSFFPTEMVPKMVSGVDLGVVANRKSLATDRFMMPVKLLEYVYLKIPVVAPRLEIIESYFDEGMIKYYDPENVNDLARCILELYNNPQERESLVYKASTFYEKCSWKIQGEEYLRLLSENE